MARLHATYDKKFISTLFRNLTYQRSIFITLRLDERIFSSELFFEGTRGSEPKIRLSPEIGASINGQSVMIAFSHREMFVLFKTHFQPSTDGTYIVEKPDAINFSFRSLLPRYWSVEAGKECSISFYGHPGEYPLVSLNTNELSFLCDKRLWGKSEVVPNITLYLDTGVKVCIDGQVLYCQQEKDGHYLYGLSISESGWLPRYELFKCITKKTYPHIRWVEEFSTDQVHELYERSGYLILKPQEEMEESFAKMVKVYAKIRYKRQITASAVYFSDEKILTIGSLLRIYDRTFLGHQLASLPEGRLNLKSKLDVYFVLIDFLINHPYCKNFITYFDINLSWHQKIYKRFGNYIDDRRKFIFDELEFFDTSVIQPECEAEQNGYSVNVLDEPKEFIEFCEKSMEPLEMDCYAYGEMSFNINEITQIYEVLDIYVARRLWSVKKQGKVVAYAVAEAFSDGLNIFNLLDMCRVYFTETECEKKEALKALIIKAAQFFRKYGKQSFYVVFKINNENVKSLEFEGFVHRHSAGRVMMSKKGIVEYKALLAMSYRWGR